MFIGRKIQGYYSVQNASISQRRTLQMIRRSPTDDERILDLLRAMEVRYYCYCYYYREAGRQAEVKARAISNMSSIPLVGKLEIFLSRSGQTRYQSFISGGGTADHLTGSPLTN